MVITLWHNGEQQYAGNNEFLIINIRTLMTPTTPTSTINSGLTWKPWRFDLRTLAGAALAVLLLRVLLGLWVLPVSAAYPETELEQQVGLLPGDAPLGAWLQRVLLMPWMRYDALNYEKLILHGYSTEQGTTAFHPLYFLLAGPVAWATGGNAPLALLLVSTLASMVLCFLFARYVAEVHAPELANRAGWLLLLLPPSFILLAPYNEATFMALAVGSIWAMQRERWWLAGLLGGLAALTRQQGIALALPMAWALVTMFRERRLALWHIGALALIPGAYGAFVAFRKLVLGDYEALLQAQGPLEFLRNLLVSPSSEKIVQGQRIAWPWEGIIDQTWLVFTQPYSYYLAFDLVLGMAMVLVVVLGWRVLTMHERLFGLAIVGLSLCYYNGERFPLLSLPRHMLIAFPLYIVLAHWFAAGRRLRWLLVLGVLFHLLLAALFVRRGWIS